MRWLFFIAFFYCIKTGLRISLMYRMILNYEQYNYENIL
jgi:hypothetical protein